MMKKKGLLLAGMAFCLSLLGLTGMAAADTYGVNDINNLGFLYEDGNPDNDKGDSDLKTGVTRVDDLSGLSGTYDFTYLGFEAANTNNLSLASNGAVIFTNAKQIDGNWVTQMGSEAYGVDFGEAFFKDISDDDGKVWLTGLTNLKIYAVSGVDLYIYTGSVIESLNNDYMYYVIGFGDGDGDYDYDDLVVAVKTNTLRSQVVPIPGAVWLLGSGILGLAGIRIRSKKRKAQS